MGRDAQKTKAELIAELEALRASITQSGGDHDTRALRESEERYRIVTEISRDIVTVSNDSGTVIFANPAVETVFGYTPEEIVGTSLQDYFDLIHPDDRDRYKVELQEIKQLGDTVRYTPFRALRKDGSWIWLRVIGTSYLSSSGQRCLLEVNQDITEQMEVAERRQRIAELTPLPPGHLKTAARNQISYQ